MSTGSTLISSESGIPWAKAYPYQVSYSNCLVVDTEDSGYAIFCTSGEHVYQGLVIRTDGDGSILWTCSFGLNSSIEITRAIKCHDGGFAIIGRSFSVGHNGAGFLWVARLADNGTVLWQNEYTDCYWGMDIQECQDGGYVIAASEPDVVRINESGSILWSYTSSWYRCHAWSIVECDNQDVVLTGEMSHSDSGYDAFLIRFTTSGDVIWTHTYNFGALDLGRDIIQTVEGNFAVAGESGSWNYYPRSFWLLQTDENGTVLSENSFFDGFAESIDECPDGGFALVGTRMPSGTYSEWDAAFVRTDSNGNMLWSSFCIGEDEDRAHSVVSNTTSGFAVSGWTTSEIQIITENGTITYSGTHPFLWCLDDASRENITISESSDPMVNTTTTPETSTTITTTTIETSTTTTETTIAAPTSIIVITTTSSMGNSSTGDAYFDTGLPTIIGVGSGLIVIIILVLGMRTTKKSYY